MSFRTVFLFIGISAATCATLIAHGFRQAGSNATLSLLHSRESLMKPACVLIVHTCITTFIYRPFSLRYEAPADDEGPDDDEAGGVRFASNLPVEICLTNMVSGTGI